jgi:hypothetical protein
MYPPLSRSASLTASSLSVFILADAIALVLADIFGYLDNLFSQHIEDIRDHGINEKGQLLPKVTRAQQRTNAQAKSEQNITTLLLPERYKLSLYYYTSEMNEKHHYPSYERDIILDMNNRLLDENKGCTTTTREQYLNLLPRASVRVITIE